MTARYTTVLPWGDDGEDHTVEFSYYPGSPPQYHGDAPYPGDPPELEILDVRCNHQPIELGADDEQAMAEYLLENIAEHLPQHPDL